MVRLLLPSARSFDVVSLVLFGANCKLHDGLAELF